MRDALNCVPTQHAHVALMARKVNKHKIVQDDAVHKVMLLCGHKFSIGRRRITRIEDWTLESLPLAIWSRRRNLLKHPAGSAIGVAFRL